MKHDTTQDERARMIAAGALEISPRQLNELLENAGYRIHRADCFNYTNTGNPTTYKARAMGYTHTTSGKRYAQVDAPRDTLPALQAIRRNHFVFNRGRIWEL